jgi:hypothetical protein
MKSTPDDVSMMMVMLCLWSVINLRGVRDICLPGAEEVSHDMTEIPSFAGNFPFTSAPQQVYVLILTEVTFHSTMFQLVLT